MIEEQRKHITAAEFERLLTAAGSRGRTPARDRALVLMMYRHGLRVGETIGLRWDQIDFHEKTVVVFRLKRGRKSVHPLQADEIAALQALGPKPQGYVFETAAGSHMSSDNAQRVLLTAGQLAGLPRHLCHPHALRHGCGFALRKTPTRVLQQYLGHQNIQNTVIYTDMSDEAFEGLWSKS